MKSITNNINGKSIMTAQGSAVVVEYDMAKEKFLVEYVGQGAIGWLTESEFTLIESQS